MDVPQGGIVLGLNHPMGARDGDEPPSTCGTGRRQGLHGSVEVERRDPDAQDVDSGRWNELRHAGRPFGSVSEPAVVDEARGSHTNREGHVAPSGDRPDRRQGVRVEEFHVVETRRGVLRDLLLDLGFEAMGWDRATSDGLPAEAEALDQGDRLGAFLG